MRIRWRWLSGVLIGAVGCGEGGINDESVVLAVTSRASVNSYRDQANGTSLDPSFSADGRWVAFSSRATNLDSDDTDAGWDVFVRDLRTGKTSLVSRSSGERGSKGNGASLGGRISADGRYVVFLSGATNLDPSIAFPISGGMYAYRRDLQTHTTILVSRSNSGGQPVTTDPKDKGSGSPVGAAVWSVAISGEGRRIAFGSNAVNLHPLDSDAESDVFVCEISGTTQNHVVSKSSSGVKTVAQNRQGTLSKDGRYVVFESNSLDLVSTPTLLGGQNIFRHDLATGWTQLVSMSPSGGPPTRAGPVPPFAPIPADSSSPSVSSDGRFIAFASDADNLVPGDGNGRSDIFVRDMKTDRTWRVSIHSDGAEANRESERPAISADGRFIVWYSLASNLVSGDTNGERDLFLHEVSTRATRRVSVGTHALEAIVSLKDDDLLFEVPPALPSISADGRFVAFDSEALNLVEGDTNGTRDVFVRGPLY